ncbi:hypothetical protein PhaeoP78_00349 [Phaeobacter inhibens]|nr:hypothetical protein PhaeoP78_00349 [Phaeobacter inhibens]
MKRRSSKGEKGSLPKIPYLRLSWDHRSQPNHDIQVGRSAVAAASAKGLPKADLQVCRIDPGDAAIRVDVCDAQIATFAKSADLVP